MDYRNIVLTLKYDGSAFHGWQTQPNGITVQQCMTEAARQITNDEVRITGCSRTDAGVHANMFVCTLKSQTRIPCDRLKGAFNAILPDSIAVTDCRDADIAFHPRYDCKKKTYKYMIWNGNEKNPFLVNRAYYYKYEIDEKLLNEQARDFIGTYDFSAFCACASTVDDKTRTVYGACVERQGDIVVFTFCGNGFLYNMVRIMTGTLLDIGSGRIPVNTIKDIILSKDRSRAGVTAPAHGLYLDRVEY
ncbi:MAG: tRNA pseudouridine(38-40) synthase TruA [Clostridia bacterium]|nr:tRNA pseudouridine(38-40) synthase TruA [Clostridia bacterium]